MNIHTEYPKAWDSMLEDCRNATSHIYFEHFILQDFKTGEVGHTMLEVLKKKAREGVKIKMIVDVVGSFEFYTSPLMRKEVTDTGIELEFFSVVPRWRAYFPFNMFHRDHRKIIIVDDRVMHVGGVILSEISRGWHDINLRMDDVEYIQEVRGAFFRIWDEIRGNEEHKDLYDMGNGTVLKNNPEHNDLYQDILLRVKNAPLTSEKGAGWKDILLNLI